MEKTYNLDQSKRGEQLKIDAYKKMKSILYWFVPILFFLSISDIEDKWIGLIGFGSFPIIMAIAFLVRQYIKPLSKELTFRINYETDEISRSTHDSFDLNANIKYFGRIVHHKEGIKLFKKGYHSYMSYLSNYSNLNDRYWSIFIPAMTENFEEIVSKFKEKNWL